MAFGDACSLVNSRTSLTLSLFNLMLNSGAYRLIHIMRILDEVKNLLIQGKYQYVFLLKRKSFYNKNDEFNSIYETCENTLSERYLNLINGYIQTNNEIAAKETIDKYIDIIGKDTEIDSIITRMKRNDGEKELPSNNQSYLIRLIYWTTLIPFTIEVIANILFFVIYNYNYFNLFKSFATPITSVVYFIFLLTLTDELSNSKKSKNKIRKIAVTWFFLSILMSSIQYYFYIANVFWGLEYNFSSFFKHDDHAGLTQFITSIITILIFYILYTLRRNTYSVFFKPVSIGIIASLIQTVIGCCIYVFDMTYFSGLGLLLYLLGWICWYIFLFMLLRTINLIKS